jgi:WD40 repeat protein
VLYIIAVDVFEELGLFVTGGKDGFVKVWDIKKELVREVKFPEAVNAVAFANSECDILVGHLEKVSIISAAHYKPFSGLDTLEWS